MNFKNIQILLFLQAETPKNLGIMEFKSLIAQRRSIRKYSDRPVPRDVMDRMLAEALTAPSARNTRTTRFLVVDDPALVAPWPTCAITGLHF